jgi:TonB family protein
MIINYLLFAFWCLFAGDDLPTFKGGQKNLDNYIAQSIIYPEYAKFNCLQGTIRVSFQLTRKGRIFNSKIEKGYGIDLDKEALRVVRLTSGKWIVPANFDTSQNLSLPINFSLKEYNCEAIGADEIREAIAAYKDRQGLTSAIINYYSRKPSGKTEDEEKIQELKQQLGYNDKFLDRLIRQGNQKLRQGDKESACEDFAFVRQLGSDKADKLLMANCTK